MGTTIANLKARLTLETDQYLAEAKKVIRETSSLGEHLQKTMRGIAKGYAHAAFEPLKELIAVQAVDEMVRGLAEVIRTVDFSPFKKGVESLDLIEQGLDKVIQKVPIIGGFWEVGKAISEKYLGTSTEGYDPDHPGMGLSIKRTGVSSPEELRKYNESLKPGQDAVADMQFQLRLLQAQNDEQRILVQAEHDREELLKKIPDDGNKQTEQMREQLKLMSQQIEAAKAKDLMDKQAQARANERQQAEERREKENENFMEQLEDSLRQQTMSEKERFEYQLAQKDLDEQDLARAREIFDLTHQQKMDMHTNSVSGISSAVGSIRIAGSVDYSQQRMATSLDVIKAATTKTSDLTQKILENQRTA